MSKRVTRQRCSIHSDYAPGVDPLQIERALAERLSAYPPRVRQVLLEVLEIRDDDERARRIGKLYADERSRSFAEVLIDLEEEPGARAVLVGMLREADRAAIGTASRAGAREATFRTSSSRTRQHPSTATCRPRPALRRG
jgi:hypothetical protein